MNEEDLENTNFFDVIKEEDIDINEQVEEFEDRIDYLDIEEDKKEKLRKLCLEIKKETHEKTKEFLFKELIKDIEN